MDNETRARIEKDCKNAIQCLYIAVEESVAQDVDNKVSAYVHLLKTEHSRITELLKEKDERISELLEALEAVIRLKPLIDYPNNTKEKHIGEAMAIGGMLHKVKTAIEKVKGYQNEISLNDET